MKLIYQYMAIFFTFSITSNHLHPLQVVNCDSNSRLVMDEDDQARHLEGGGVERVARHRPPPPPPPVTTKLKIYPSNILQNPPYCTSSQLKMKKIPGGMPPDPLTCVPHSLNAKYHYSIGILQGVQLTYFGNTPAIQNSTPPPFKNFWARAWWQW